MVETTRMKQDKINTSINKNITSKMSALIGSDGRELDDSSSTNTFHIPEEIVATVMTFLEFDGVVKCSRVSTTWVAAVRQLCSVRLQLDIHEDGKLKFVTSRFGKITDVHVTCANQSAINADLMTKFLSSCSLEVQKFVFKGSFNYVGCHKRLQGAFECLRFASALQILKLDRCVFDTVGSLVHILQNKDELKVLHLSNVCFCCKFSFGNPEQSECNIIRSCVEKLKELEELVLAGGWKVEKFNARTLFSASAKLKKLVIFPNRTARPAVATRDSPDLKVQYESE